LWVVVDAITFLMEEAMPKHSLDKAAPWIIAMMLFTVASSAAMAQSEQQKLVNEADTTLSNFVRDPQMTWLHDNIGRAKGLLIAPTVAKAGFIFGGSGGRAVLVARDGKSGKWVGPAFYTMATASVGFQAGISVSEMITMVMSDKAMDALLANSVKFGPDASIAAGPVGAGAKADIVTDMVAFSRSKGVYGGINLDGTVVAVSNDWNDAYYGKKGISPPDVLVRMNAHAKGADKLLADVSRAAGKK
jgi:lipid-binding SYLF domain-containing protein